MRGARQTNERHNNNLRGGGERPLLAADLEERSQAEPSGAEEMWKSQLASAGWGGTSNHDLAKS